MLDLLHQIPTAFLFFCAAFVVMVLPQGNARNIVLLGTPIIAAIQVWTLGMGEFYTIPLFWKTLLIEKYPLKSRFFINE